MYVKEMWCEFVDWTFLAQDKVQGLAIVNTAMSHQFHRRLGFLDSLSDHQFLKKGSAVCLELTFIFSVQSKTSAHCNRG